MGQDPPLQLSANGFLLAPPAADDKGGSLATRCIIGRSDELRKVAVAAGMNPDFKPPLDEKAEFEPYVEVLRQRLKESLGTG